jgi:hypothetical protein
LPNAAGCFLVSQLTASRALTSGTPKIFESFLAEFGVARGVLYGPMPKPILNCPRVVTCIGQRVAAGVPQHVDVNLEWEARALADAHSQTPLVPVPMAERIKRPN